MVEAGPDVKPKTVGMGSKTRIRAAWLVPTKRAPYVVYVHAGRYSLDDLVCLGDGGLLDPHLPDLIIKSGHSYLILLSLALGAAAWNRAQQLLAAAVLLIASINLEPYCFGWHLHHVIAAIICDWR